MPPNFQPHTPPTPSPKPPMPPPTPNPLRQDHSIPVGEQHTVDINNLPKNAGNNLFQSSGPSPTHSSYDFMLNQAPAGRTKMSLPQGSLGKVIAALAGLITIIIVISLVSSLLKSPSNTPYLDSVVADQQEIMHISTVASNESDLSSGNQTFISTAYFVLSSNSTQLQTYLTSKGAKASTLVLNSKLSKTTDNELTNAESAGDFNSTFTQVAKTELNTYLQDLSIAYNKVTGPHGRALLTSFYKQANLLLVSLSNGS